MKNNGVYSHIITDHHHYFADGGATYHQRYSSWELVRGQAIDRWKGEVQPLEIWTSWKRNIIRFSTTEKIT